MTNFGQARVLSALLLAVPLSASGAAGRATGAGRGRRHAAVRGRGDGHRHRPQARGERPGGALLGGGAVRAGPAEPRGRDHRGRLGQRRRVLGAEPRSRPEPSRDARRLGRPDRARPARGQGAGRRLPRRVGRLDVAVHARPRPRLRLRAARLLRRGDGGRHRPAQPDRRPPLVRL